MTWRRGSGDMFIDMLNEELEGWVALLTYVIVVYLTWIAIFRYIY